MKTRRRIAKKQTQIFPYKIKLYNLIFKNWKCKSIQSNTVYLKSGYYFDGINLNVYISFERYIAGAIRLKPQNVWIYWCNKCGHIGKHLLPEDIKALLRRFKNGKY